MSQAIRGGQASLIGTIVLAALVGCSSGLDTLGGLTSAVNAHIHMNSNSDYESVDDAQLLVNLGDIYLGEGHRAWFTIQSVGNAPVLIEAMSYVNTQGDGWGKPELKINENGGSLTPPHTLEARDEYLVAVAVAPMVAGTLSATLKVTIAGMDSIHLTVVGRAKDGTRAPVVPGSVVDDFSPELVQVPEIEVWPEQPTEEPEPVIEEEPELEIDEEANEEVEELVEGEEGVDASEQLPVQVQEPEQTPEPEVEIEEEPEPEVDDEPETLIGGNLLADDEGQDVIVTCVGKGGGYTHELYLDNTNTFICDSADIGTQVNLGTFPAGTELIFRLDVLNSGYSYYTGSAERNPDSEIHVRIDSTESGVYRFGFEDLYGGGDRDYDDCVFEVSGSDADWLE